MKTIRYLQFATVLCALCFPAMAGAQIERALESVGPGQGICVVLGENACDAALKLAEKTELLIYVQAPNRADLEATCWKIDEAGYYGTRVFVGRAAGRRLGLADNVADAVVAAGRAPRLARGDVLRVLRPGGKAIRGDRTITKPFPKGVDDWSHPYHGPDNNPQSRDRIAVAPYLTQFLAEPRYAPVPQVAVASAGRVFKAFGHVAFKTREEALLNKLVAYNGYNGAMLWQRDLHEGVMIHRNTLIATPTTVYLGDDKSCKLIDAATGELRDEIAPPAQTTGGTFWKWMALEDGVLHALIGQDEQRDSTKRWRRDHHGWPWNPISEGFNQPEHPWGFGRTVLAINPETKEVLWTHREDEPVDGRAICMKNGRIYIFRFGSYLAALDAKDGNVIWRKTPQNARELFRSLGEYLNRQDWRTNWRTTCYLKCSDKALYFAGPPIGKVLAVSTKDGSIMWENPYSNFQLVLRDDGLYAISGQIDKHPSKKLDPLTGDVLAEISMPRRACTRPNGSADAIFFRAEGGSVRLDMAGNRPQWISPMRPPCHDGVTIANGLLYWWPSVCDCQLTLYGITCLAPAGDFDFVPEATEAERLEVYRDDLRQVARLPVRDGDWPTFRADNQCGGASPAVVAENCRVLWRYRPQNLSDTGGFSPSAPVAAGGLVFYGRTDGTIVALDAQTGKVAWKSYTGGAIRLPPTIWRGRALVGSGDGSVYAFEAKTGRPLWRFRAAPAERIIPVYGTLQSTWPAASGVLVDDGSAYVAAGIVNYDGTYVYALDAATGKIKWQNNSSGHLDKDARTGVSVQGHLLLHRDKLYLAGGTSMSPAVYEADSGKCLNDPRQLAECVSRWPRGWELSLLGDHVAPCGRPFYAHRDYGVYDATVSDRVFLAASGPKDIVWASSQNRHTVHCYEKLDRASLNKKLANPGSTFHVQWKNLAPRQKPLWSYDCNDCVAVAAAANAVVVAQKSKVVALDVKDGKVLWTQPIPAAPVAWGLAIDSKGRVVASLEDGRVVCFGSPRAVAVAANMQD